MGAETITSGALDYVLIPHFADWSKEPELSRKWITKVVTGITGAEDRSRLRSSPIYSLKWSVTTANEQEEARLEARVLAAKLSGKAAAPWFGRGIQIVTATSGAGSITLASSPWTPSAGDWVILMAQSEGAQPTYEAKLVTASGGGVLTISGTLSRTWPAGTLCYPLIIGDFTTDTRQMLMGYVSTWNFAIEFNTEPENGGTIQVDGLQPVVATIETYAPPWGPYVQVDGYQPVVASLETYATHWEDALQVDGFEAVAVLMET